MQIKKTENTVPNIWEAQENMIHFYRLLAIGLGVVVSLLFVLVLVIYFRDPIVVIKGQSTQEFYSSNRARASIEKADVEAFVKRFLTALYVWPDFNTERTIKEISPFSEDGFVAKAVDVQSQKYGKELKGKKLAQAITFVDVNVLEDRVVCKFDRILKVEGIPIVIPTEVTLAMIQGSQTQVNPMGIYVSGITEREGAK